MAVVVVFLNEELFLPTVLTSLAGQTRPPDRLLLVDDGSIDQSADLAAQFADRHDYATALRRPRRPRAADRLADAPELQAFLWALARLPTEYEILVKLDADVRLPPTLLESVERRMRSDPQLGITGPVLSQLHADGAIRRERSPGHHVRGATKFYRRSCYDQISPLSPILGWDTTDEVTARMRGWRTESFVLQEHDPVHLRPTGSVDGRLRAFRRWGACAYAIGDHPLWLALSTARRCVHRPWLLGGLAYLAGWSLAAARRNPRAPLDVRRHRQREQIARLRRGPLRLRPTTPAS